MLTRSRQKRLQCPTTIDSPVPNKLAKKEVTAPNNNNTGGNILTLLPPEILSKIFLNLRNSDLFLSCALVSKSFHDFLYSDLFFEGLIIREFGPQRAKAFLSIDGALGKFKEDLTKNHAYRLDDVFKEDIWKAKTVLTREMWSYEEFFETVLSKRPKFLQGKDNFPYLRSARGVTVDKWLYKVPFECYEVLDVLKPPIIFDCKHLDPEEMLIRLLDANLKPLCRTPMKDREELGIIRDYPAGLRYISGDIFANFFRIVFPSLCKIMQRTWDLYGAIAKEPSPKIRRFFDADPGLLNYNHMRPKRLELSPLAMAIRWPRNDVIELFFKRHVRFPPNTAAFAAYHNSLDVIKMLFEHGAADTNTKGEDGWPLLLHAVTCYSPVKRVADYLVDQGADVDYCNEDGTTLLMEAIKKHKIDAVRYLVLHGANVHAVNNKNRTPIQLALGRCPMAPCLDTLLQVGAEVNKKITLEDGSQSTLLIEAVRKGVEIKVAEGVKVLLKYGADVDAKNSDGLTAIDFAKKGGEKTFDLLSLLRESKKEKKTC